MLLGKGEALKDDEYVLKGCREVSKSYHNILNCGNEALSGDEDALKREREMLEGYGKAFMCDRLFLEVTGMD